jgi:protein-L-isoaspartate(D-aspartate) O-methyltransferase
MTDGANDGSAESSSLRLLRHLDASVHAPQGFIRAALARVPRALFLPSWASDSAYLDTPITILGNDNSVRSVCSQPSAIVAMLDLLNAQPGQAILEIGGGTGFNAALLGEIVGPSGRVDSLEIECDLAECGNKTIRSLGIQNTTVVHGNGMKGGMNPPYDGIIVSTGISDIPEAWIQQLSPGGRIVCPLVLGPGIQKGVGFCKVGEELQSFRLIDCSFMPIVGDAEWPTTTLTNGQGIWIECSSSLQIKWGDVSKWLHTSKRSSVPIGALRRSEILSGFDLWLALHAEGNCCVATSLAGRPDSNLIPEVFCYEGGAANTACTRGLVTTQGIALLSVLTEGEYNSEITLGITCGGEDVTSNKLVELLSKWDAVGRPGLANWQVTMLTQCNVGSTDDEHSVLIKRGRNTFNWKWRSD